MRSSFLPANSPLSILTVLSIILVITVTTTITASPEPHQQRSGGQERTPEPALQHVPGPPPAGLRDLSQQPGRPPQTLPCDLEESRWLPVCMEDPGFTLKSSLSGNGLTEALDVVSLLTRLSSRFRGCKNPGGKIKLCCQRTSTQMSAQQIPAAVSSSPAHCQQLISGLHPLPRPGRPPALRRWCPSLSMRSPAAPSGSTGAQGFPVVGPLPEGPAGTCGLRTDHIHPTANARNSSLHATWDLAKPDLRSHIS